VRYAAIWEEAVASELADDVKAGLKKRFFDPTYSDEYMRLLVQWIKVALYAGDDRELRLLMFGYAPKPRKGKKKTDAD
jgi:hypothetical protein